MARLLEALTQLFRGRSGVDGLPGPQGAVGAAGPAGADAPLTLALELVMVAPDYGNMNRMLIVWDAAKACTQWWRENVGIRLAISIRCLQSDLAPVNPYLLPLRVEHYWRLGGHTPTVFVFSDLGRVGDNHLGEAFVDEGMAVAAGSVLLPGGDSQLDEVITHEISHIGGLSHEEGTFMSATLELHNRRVTPAQRQALREWVRTL